MKPARSTAVLLCVVGLALAVPASPARAEVGVSRLRVGATADVSEPLAVFPPGIQRVFARFDYAEASGQRIGLDVTGYGGVVVQQTSRRYEGEGSDVAEIDGTDVLLRLTSELVRSAESARSSARQAATQQFGVLEYLNGVQAGVVRMGTVVTMLESVRAPEVDRDDLAELRRIEAQVSDLVARAMRAGDDEQRKQLAARMAQPLEQAVGLANGLDGAAGGAVDVPLPVSGSAWQYVVRVSVDGNPAASTEFAVDGGQVLLPSLSRKAPVHR